MKTVDAVAEILRREGIEHVVCFPTQQLIEGAAKIGIRPIMCRQERIGMAIADGISRTTNGKKIGVFTMQYGPGTENTFPGVAQAFADNVPTLIIADGYSTDKSQISPNFSAVNNYAQVTKWCARVDSIGRVSEMFRRAFYQLRTGKGGPVLVEVPNDFWQAEIGELDYTPVKGNRFGPDSQEVKEVCDALLNAQNLVIHAGQGVLYAEATDDLVTLAELLQAPVMTTLPGKSGFPENHPLSLGASAASTTKPIVQYLDTADVVFGIGCSFTRTNYGRMIPPGKIIIHSTNDPSDINKDSKADYALIGDAKLVIQAVIEEIKSRNMPSRQERGTEVQAAKKAWLDEWMGQMTSDEVPINQYRVIRDLMNNIDRPNSIVTHDAGSPRDQVVPFWEALVPRSYQGWGKTTQLGYGLGITMGAKLAEPDKLCINIMGDAAIGMVGMDIETAARSELGILTIVFNNGAMAIERSSMPTATEKYGSVYVGGDYRGVAESLGAWAKRVETPDEFLPTLKEAVAATQMGQPALIECIVKEGYDFSKF